LLTPYPLVVTAKGYGFTTTSQVSYEVYFSDVTHTFSGVNARVFSFGFDCTETPEHIDADNLPPDTRIGETIAAILDDFFSSNLDIIVYVPMDTDRKGELRLRLFDFWWARYKPSMNCQDIEKERYTFTYPDDAFIATMLYRVEIKLEAQAVISGLESLNDGK